MTFPSPEALHFRAFAPKNMPAHAWPVFPSEAAWMQAGMFAPAWWAWYRVEVSDSPHGRVVEMRGSGGSCDVDDVWRIGGNGPSLHRTVMTGTRDAALAAFRLLSGHDANLSKETP